MSSDFEVMSDDSFEFVEDDESFDNETAGDHDSEFEVKEDEGRQKKFNEFNGGFKPTLDEIYESKDSEYKSILNHKAADGNLYQFNKRTVFQIFEDVLMKQAEETAVVLALTKEQAFFLLISFNWNSEKLIEKYTDNNKSLDELGYFTKDDVKIGQQKRIYKKNFAKQEIAENEEWICEICYDEEAEEAFGLSCGHFFCVNCYKRFVQDELVKGKLVQCMNVDCSRIFVFEDFDSLFCESENYLRKLMIKRVFKIDVDEYNEDDNEGCKTKIKPIKVRFKPYHPVELGKFIFERYSSDKEFKMNESSLINDGDTKQDITELTTKLGSIDLNNQIVRLIEVDNDYFEDYGDQEDYIRYIDELDDFNNYSSRSEYIKNIVKKYVDTHKNYHWCPAPDCNSVVDTSERLPMKDTYHVSSLPITNCVQNHTFCFNCNFEKHYPVPCSLVERWVERCNNEAESLNWIQVNTKQCPRCDQPIEKNGGCNHMNCMKCAYQFCWICLKNWDLHINNNKCNFYVPNTNDEKAEGIDIMRQNLDKYIYYFQRFQAHQMSAKQDFKSSDSISTLIKKLQKTQGISWIDCQFLKSCIVSLLNARSTLQWSYVFCFFLKDNNKNINKNLFLIFQQNQERLSLAVEELSKLFEIDKPKQILKKKTDFIVKARYCTSVQMNLIASIESGLVNQSFVFLERNQ